MRSGPSWGSAQEPEGGLSLPEATGLGVPLLPEAFDQPPDIMGALQVADAQWGIHIRHPDALHADGGDETRATSERRVRGGRVMVGPAMALPPGPSQLWRYDSSQARNGALQPSVVTAVELGQLLGERLFADRPQPRAGTPGSGQAVEVG